MCACPGAEDYIMPNGPCSLAALMEMVGCSGFYHIRKAVVTAGRVQKVTRGNSLAFCDMFPLVEIGEFFSLQLDHLATGKVK